MEKLNKVKRDDWMLEQNVNIKLNLKNKIIMTNVMKQALYVLSLPTIELEGFLLSESEKNPFCNWKIKNKSVFYDFNSIQHNISFHDHLLNQAKLCFENKNLKIAKYIIGNLDKRGFFQEDIEKIANKFKTSILEIKKILNEMKTFTPNGVCAKDLQECILNQVQKDPIIFKIVKDHFENLCKNNLIKIARALKTSPQLIQKKLKQLSINFNPRNSFSKTSSNMFIFPDLIIEENKVFFGSNNLDDFSINSKYIDLLNKEDKKVLHPQILSAKFLKKAIENRQNTLLKIGKYLLKHQKDFILKESYLKPLPIKQIANDLNLHQSTISRAISNKYIKIPRGTFALKDLFSNFLKNNLSKKNALDVLKSLIDKEDKKNPLSDNTLEKKMKQKGFLLKRRTINKYRNKLLIQSANKRKVF